MPANLLQAQLELHSKRSKHHIRSASRVQGSQKAFAKAVTCIKISPHAWGRFTHLILPQKVDPHDAPCAEFYLFRHYFIMRSAYISVAPEKNEKMCEQKISASVRLLHLTFNICLILAAGRLLDFRFTTLCHPLLRPDSLQHSASSAAEKMSLILQACHRLSWCRVITYSGHILCRLDLQQNEILSRNSKKAIVGNESLLIPRAIVSLSLSLSLSLDLSHYSSLISSEFLPYDLQSVTCEAHPQPGVKHAHQKRQKSGESERRESTKRFPGMKNMLFSCVLFLRQKLSFDDFEYEKGFHFS